MQDAFAYCTELVRAADKDRFLATLFAPAAHRDALCTLYAFNLEVARIREAVNGPLPGELRLQWWREAIEGGREAEAAGHPVAAALRATIERYKLSVAAFDELLTARSFDLYDEPMPALNDLETYAERTSSAVIALAATILMGGGDPGPGTLFRNAGLALALTALLRAFPAHAARRQLYVPLALLERYGAQPEAIFARKATSELRAALAELRLRARRHLSEARAQLAGAPDAIAPALLPLALVRPLLERMERRGYDPFRPDDIPQWRKQWRLWRAARFGLKRVL
jgi:phytoene synthase